MAKKPEDIPLRSGDIHILAGKSFGPEKLILDAMREIGLEDMRVNAGANPWHAKMNVGAIVARMCGRTSDRASRRWLMSDSSLGLLMGIDFKDTSEMSLRRASDALVASKESLDEQLRAGFSPSVREAGGEQKGKGRIFRIDCTNVHYEGQAKGNSLASRGHSKAKRFDCKLVSIAIAINEDGFIEIAHFLPGNVSEPSILSDMLDGLGVRAGDTVMMDAGIFTEANRKLLESRGILYVAPHSGLRENFNFRMADRVEMPDGNVVRAYRVADPSGTFMEIIGHSTERQKSDIEYTQTRCNRFKAEADSISKKLGDSGTRKDIRYIHERIGRLRQKYGVGKHFKIVVVPSDSDASQAASIICTRVEVAGSKADCPGVYRFRTNNLSLNAQEVVELYRTLVEIEAVFRCLKSELGTRPIYHWTADRANGHIYIACLACQIVNHIRLKLKKKGINYSWTTVKDLLDDCRLGAVLGVSSDGKDDVLIIQSTPPTKKVKTVYRAMGPGYGARIHLILLAPHRKKRGAPHRGRDGPTWAELKRFRVRCVE
ncbi:MAG: IS1634 family transposase [Deltaproteobacteria bacterium]|nr:IS1634 family transposase [Deltaproteobacteria bacterium]